MLTLWQHANTMEKTSITPVELAIDLFGGVRKLAKAIGRDPAAVSRWKRSGLIPTQVQRKLLTAAAERNISISAEDLIHGRDVHA